MFMYAIGLRVGPQFFSGLARDGFGLIGFAVIVVTLNWIICVYGAKLAGLAPGYAAGLISGSFTVTAVIGVASSAVEGGAVTLPSGITSEQVGANLAAGYAISYILSSIGIILMIKYLPTLFGYDAVAEGKAATELYGGGKDSAPPPGSNEGFVMGHSPTDIRAYRVENEELVGQKPMDLFDKYQVPVLRVTRGGEWMDVENNEPLQKGDVITVRADVERLITKGGGIGPEVDDPLSRNIDLEVAEIVIGKSEYAGKTLEQVGKQVGYGLTAKALFRGGMELPVLPDEKLEVGDVIRIVGPAWTVERGAERLGGKVVRASINTEFMYVAIAMSIGYMIGLLSVTIAGIPFALGTSAGVMLAGIGISTLRTRNPTFGGPVSEGARSLLQDIGLNLFVVVLAARRYRPRCRAFARAHRLHVWHLHLEDERGGSGRRRRRWPQQYAGNARHSRRVEKLHAGDRLSGAICAELGAGIDRRLPRDGLDMTLGTEEHIGNQSRSDLRTIST
jgi:putative transport protein